ncbi:metallophosphoesterase [Sphingobium aromaticiconvertens]|uniref:metallophosphoesterase n=1 Tax=Sphingobium aromaticiconvertens TaxID=365341 RepID=UPI0030186297
MLNFLKRKRSAPEPSLPPSVGSGRRVYAIGDIHGRADLLLELLELIGQDDARRGHLPFHLVLLGDLIDRGPRSAHVIDQAMLLARSGIDVRFIKGNHEEVFILAARGDMKAARFFTRIGGMETLASYGLPPAEQAMMNDAQLTDWMVRHVPRAHVDFVDGFEDQIEFGDYLFVHAGIKPHIPLDVQNPSDLRWIRAEFLEHQAPFDRMIVHGHTITDVVDERPNRIGIDTGAYYSGHLTAIGLEGEERWFLATGAPA